MKACIVGLMLLASVVTAHAGNYTVRAGDTLYSVMGSIFTPSQINTIYHDIKKLAPDFMLKIGSGIDVLDGGFILRLDPERELIVSRRETGAHVRMRRFERRVVSTVVAGTVDSTLVDAMRRIDERPALAYQVARIFEWEIDFTSDLRPGDTFNLLVKKMFVRDRFVGYGEVLAADFTVRGQNHRALWYEDDEIRGHFSPDGLSLKKGFIKLPVTRGRVTSRYSRSRLHPILKKYLPHTAIDIGAPRGTPVLAAGDGTVEVVSSDSVNGRYLKLRHMNGYQTFYLHLSNYAKGIRKGKRVRQGQTIGYVGSTGRSTGPHLDYRIAKGRRFYNPLTFNPPVVELNSRQLAEMQNATDAWVRVLDGLTDRFAAVWPMDPGAAKEAHY